ncbi:Serine/threonine-protein kinase DCLK2 [Acipenser ruthenus]|uniref:Serine/threonine-protein kinase DCLK2 n=1 Tax=Acipenser ruthenus TaxID=7906 RepID=A0A444V4M4_ACIRT|nr:Serine/threonine-protein kinase DCLK2 [Acipenser ruthenus]
MHIFDNWESLTLSGSLIEIETQAGRQFDFESGADGCFTINSSEVAELSIGDKLIEVNGINVAHFSKLELNSLMDEWNTARLLILHNNNQNNETQTEEGSYGETKGGDLFDAITSSTKYTEKDASAMVYNLAGALKYLHCLNIVHRDIKPENLLVGTCFQLGTLGGPSD